MQERTITVTLEKAKEWYSSDNATLKEIALQAFSKEDLKPFDFTKIKTFGDALDALGYLSTEQNRINSIVNSLYLVSKASAAMFMLNIIKRALNKGYDLHITENAKNEDYTWYPYFRFITKDCTCYNQKLERVEVKKIGKFESKEITYDVFSIGATVGSDAGLGGFDFYSNMGNADADIGFLGCATEEIAKHFGLHFGMLVMEAMYGDMVDFKTVEQ